MLTKGRVSVVIAVKDGGDFLAHAVASVRDQTYSDIELIVVDDGSTDGTTELAAQLPIDHFFVLPFHQGVSTARNVGMAMATGQYMTFLDADDWYLPEKVARQVAYLEEHPECGCLMTNHELLILPGVVPPPFLEHRLTLEGTAEMMGLPICFMARTLDLYDCGGFNPGFVTAEDMDILFRLQRSGRMMHRLNEELVVKRIHGSNASYQGELMNRDLLRSMRQLLQPTRTTVSAVIPVRNGGAFLQDAVESVLAQTRPVDQIVIVDDGSTDETAEVAQHLASSHAQIVFVRQPHHGVGAARNHGILAAQGSLIAFLDADDLWLPDKIERQLSELGRHPEAVGVHGLVEEFNDTDLGEDADPPRPPYPGPGASDIVLKRSVFVDVGPFQTMHGQPEWVEWWGRALDAQLPVNHVPHITTRRRRHVSNTTRSIDPRAYLGVVRDALNRRRMS